MKLTIVLATIFAVATASSVPHFGFPEDDIERGRVINGQAAAEGEAPYIVSLKSSASGSHFCGGSIIAPQWVVTAAHCLGGSIYVAAGLHNRNDASQGQVVRVDQQIRHESYGGSVGPYDIALLHLEKPLTLNSRVQSVSLPANSTPQSGVGVLYGWGKDKASSNILPNVLQTVSTDLLPYAQCKTKLPSSAPLHSTNICSSSRNQGISACNGDSGGPLVQKTGSNTVLVGVVSWGYIPCGAANYPSVYTHTGAHLEWIRTKQALFEN